MRRRGSLWRLVFGAMLSTSVPVFAQQAGSIRGVAYDKDFDAPLPGVQVLAVETGSRVLTGDDGHYVFDLVAPGRYTLVFTKDGYVRQVKADVVVEAGQLTDVDAWLSGEFTDLDEVLVQDILNLGSGSEASLLKLRLDSAALMDSIGSDLMSRAGAGDAAAALKLVAGVSAQNGKSAVIRGLPDRYVSSQMNGVRLPSADENKRAVELDQFPSAAIESVQVSKTFTPDQQGDASGGAVNIHLKGIPDEALLQFSGQVGVTSASGEDEFRTYDDGGVSFWGDNEGGHDIQFDNLGKNWTGAVGTTKGHAPANLKWSATAGGKTDVADGWKLGGLFSVFWERKSTFFDDGTNDSLWVDHPGGKLVPQTFQGTPQQGDFKTALFDVTKSVQGVQWGGLATAGLESDSNKIDIAYLYTRTTTDTATLAEDTRGKAYFFPGYDPNDPQGTGNEPANLSAAPYLRTETLDFVQRSTGTLQLTGRHTLPFGGGGTWKAPELDWTLARSTAELNEPDKRQFGALWQPASFNPGFPPFIPPFTTPATWFPYKPAANFFLGNLQRIWKDINENSDSQAVNLKLPFESWSGTDGYLKFGVFEDDVKRRFNQDTFSNFNDAGASFQGGWDEFWSAQFPFENHPITASTEDVDYVGTQKIGARYGMVDLPLTSSLALIGGERFESTQIDVINHPEPDATWYPPGSTAQVALNPGDADVHFHQNDVLPSIGLVATPAKEWTIRATYSETIARQTFKELTPILQEEFLGGPIFIGNPDLQMSKLKNYDLRADWVPDEGVLVSVSRFSKDITNPIEYVQKLGDFTYTTAVNYPKGTLNGYEFEVRQPLGHGEDTLAGLSVGANATFIDSQVTLPADEAAAFAAPGIDVHMTSRDMTNAPDHLYNVYLTWDAGSTQASLFYTVTGDTLIAGAGEASGNFVPSIYAKEYGTLNFSLSQKFGERTTVQFQAKNLTDPRIEEFYKSDKGDVTHASFTRGREFTLGLTLRF